ncbi:DUF6896 domain-containing protein [Micromonospora sp. DT228]|uniref:DUF6896 domain-containing protein n=1 Tax=Micromonospora sp. DT228 TaxID=3393443 RepID=UPI003CEB5196
MTKAVDNNLGEVIDAFFEARRIISRCLGVASAAELVAAVLNGSVPRNGHCQDGVEYMVHGVGYTVTFSNDAQAHIDASGAQRDCFKLYDLRFYLDEITDDIPSLEALSTACDGYAQKGALRRVDKVTFEFVDRP